MIEFLGSGTYGRVYRPFPIWCDAVAHLAPRNEYVGKISVQEDAPLPEMLQFQKKRRIVDPKNRFTVPFQGYCKKTKKNDFVLFWQPRGDIEYVFLYGGRSLEKFHKRFDAVQSDGLCRALFFHSFRNLVHGLRELAEKKLAHLDIKMENLVYNWETNQVKLIDFDLLTEFSAVPTQIQQLNTVYYVWPPELNFLYVKPRPSTSLASVRQSLGFLSVLAPKKYPILENIVSFLASKAFDPKNIDFRKLDLYALGLVWLKIFGISDIRIFELVRTMIEPDPSKRLSLEDLIDRFETIDQANRKQYHF